MELRTKLLDMAAALVGRLTDGGSPPCDRFADAMVSCVILVDLYLANDTNGLAAKRRLRAHDPVEEFLVGCAVVEFYRKARFPRAQLWEDMNAIYRAIVRHHGLDRQHPSFYAEPPVIQRTVDHLAAVTCGAVPDGSQWVRAALRGAPVKVADVSIVLILIALAISDDGLVVYTDAVGMRRLSVAGVTVAAEVCGLAGEEVRVVRANVRSDVLGLFDGDSVRKLVPRMLRVATAISPVAPAGSQHLWTLLRREYKDAVGLLEESARRAPPPTVAKNAAP